MRNDHDTEKLSGTDQPKGETFYERLTSSQAHAILFACGIGLVALALVKSITGERTETIARWRWLFQFARVSMGLDTFGEAVFLGLIGVLMICWAVIGTNQLKGSASH